MNRIVDQLSLETAVLAIDCCDFLLPVAEAAKGDDSKVVAAWLYRLSINLSEVVQAHKAMSQKQDIMKRTAKAAHGHVLTFGRKELPSDWKPPAPDPLSVAFFGKRQAPQQH